MKYQRALARLDRLALDAKKSKARLQKLHSSLIPTTTTTPIPAMPNDGSNNMPTPVAQQQEVADEMARLGGIISALKVQQVSSFQSLHNTFIS